MTHQDLTELGFEVYGLAENDPYYKIVFRPPFKFGISYLSGNLENGCFHLFANAVVYTDKDELKKVIDIVGSEIYR